ncbi:MAG: efflux RND transporter permease subunit [Spirochaetes bacterium]|nr:MAG: efflux RND transporter permease subunit [Spirochaetota bacterium]
MNIAKLAIRKPVFISCIVIIILIMGFISYKNIGVEMLPDISFPTLSITTVYPGSSPKEIEQLITKPLEDELGSVSGIKHLSSESKEGLSLITVEFSMGVNLDRAAQDLRDKISVAKNNLPDDITDDPVVSKIDYDAQPVIRMALISDLPAGDMYDLARETIKPKLEKINDVGNVQIIGGSRREIQIEIDQNKINEYVVPMTRIVSQIKSSGSNVPIGKQEEGVKETVFRAMGEYTTLDQVRNTMISFSGDIGSSISVNTLGRVSDGTKDIESIGYIYNSQKKNNTPVQSCIYLDVVKQSGKNSVTVADAVKSKIDEINTDLKQAKGNSYVRITSDQSRWIKTNVEETVSTIIMGVILAVLVVYLFLGNIRSTIITGIAIPNSLLGAVVLMDVMGYTFNMMTLMALSLVVGLLVDDAIVVRENIFRKIEEGHNSFKAAELGTTEVTLAVIATTLAILSVFFPIGMLTGVIGRLFKQFGFTVVFAMIVSLFDALTVAPFLSAYFAGDGKKSQNKVVVLFEKFQVKMEEYYVSIMGYCLKHPLIVIIAAIIIFISSIGFLSFVKQTFISETDNGEFAINIEMPAGTSLKGTGKTISKIEENLREFGDIDYYGVTIGNSNGEVRKGQISCFLHKDRKISTVEVKEKVRSFLAKFEFAHPTVNNRGGGGTPYSLIISGKDLVTVEKSASLIMEQVRAISDLTDIDSTVKKGTEEFRVIFDQIKMRSLGVSNSVVGTELRCNVAGAVVGKFRENGIEYDIRARLNPEQRDIRKTFYDIRVPNTHNRMIPLSSISRGEFATGSAQISRRDKAYVVRITANLTKDGAVGSAMAKTREIIKNKIQLPSDVAYSFSGDSENFAETGASVVFALILAIVFIYLVLSSLYESYVTPFTILLAIPFALTGALLALFVTGVMIDLFSMIGMVILIGIVTKNSILLVDHAVHGVNAGLDRKEAILQAGQRRLRPILMTTFAMVAGTIPLALGIGESAKLRQSMGVSIIGGLLVSTMITLIVVPAVFEYIDRFREATESKILVRQKGEYL